MRVKETYQVLSSQVCALEMATALRKAAEENLDQALIPGDRHREEAVLGKSPQTWICYPRATSETLASSTLAAHGIPNIYPRPFWSSEPLTS